ncbi:HD family hydrolase (plasmid) [Lentzea sp. JNUCC 0626]|uniref:HD domain-containing protein n=1 Tax=Lentzea sp. JNUCC 0626 TaxID=3367513 RepID=UPI0037487D10
MSSSDSNAAISVFGFEVGHLTRTPRSGWQLAGLERPQSVAEHSFRVGILAYIIAVQEGCNPDRAATLGLFHDVPEVRTGDLNSVAKRYVTAVDPRQVVADQVAGLPSALAAHITNVIDEFESAKNPDGTAEARCARDADKLECLLTAREYVGRGYPVQPWIDTMVAAVQTQAGKQIAQDAQRISPGEWWYTTVSSYGLPAAK